MKLYEMILLEAKDEYVVKAFGPKIADVANITAPDDESRNKLVLDFVRKNLVPLDPTPNQKYLVWVSKLYADGNLQKEDFYKVTEYLNEFMQYQPAMERKDIMQYKSLPDLADALELVKEKEPATSKRQEAKSERQKLIDDGEAAVVFKNDELTVVLVKTKKASCEFGKGTRWCTAATSSHNYFSSYNRTSKLYTLYPKGKKPYLISVPRGTIASVQAADSTDRMISLGTVIATIPSSLEFLSTIMPKVQLVEFLEGNLSSIMASKTEWPKIKDTLGLTAKDIQARWPKLLGDLIYLSFNLKTKGRIAVNHLREMMGDAFVDRKTSSILQKALLTLGKNQIENAWSYTAKQRLPVVKSLGNIAYAFDLDIDDENIGNMMIKLPEDVMVALLTSNDSKDYEFFDYALAQLKTTRVKRLDNLLTGRHLRVSDKVSAILIPHILPNLHPEDQKEALKHISYEAAQYKKFAGFRGKYTLDFTSKERRLAKELLEKELGISAEEVKDTTDTFGSRLREVVGKLLASRIRQGAVKRGLDKNDKPVDLVHTWYMLSGWSTDTFDAASTDEQINGYLQDTLIIDRKEKVPTEKLPTRSEQTLTLTVTDAGAIVYFHGQGLHHPSVAAVNSGYGFTIPAGAGHYILFLPFDKNGDIKVSDAKLLRNVGASNILSDITAINRYLDANVYSNKARKQELKVNPSSSRLRVESKE